MKSLLLALAVSLALASAVSSHPAQSDDPLDRRADETAALFSPDPMWPDDHFNAAFLEAVPPARMRSILKDYHKSCGRAVGLIPLQRDSRLQGSFLILFEKNVEATLTVGIDATAPHSIGTWVVGIPQPSITDFDGLAKAFEELSGTSSLAVWELGEKEPKPLVELRPDESLAIGSAFKLYVLGALIDEIVAGKRSWKDTLALRSELRSMPSGVMQSWPVGSHHTLETLAGLMISQSDNTATDHLLVELGRARVEEAQVAMGGESADRSRPFLTTAEFFKLKWTRGGELSKAYLALDDEKRLDFLAKDVAPVSLAEIDLGAFASPLHIDAIEWFASARDLCRAMDSLKRATEGGDAARGRALLAINPGTIPPRGAFDFTGFKGGSEPGVMNLTWLAHSTGGTWYAIAATWNDSEAVLDEARFAALASRALFLIAKAEQEPSDAGD